MAASASPSKKRCIAAGVQASKELELTIYSTTNRHKLEEIMPLQKHFSKHFLEEKPKKDKIYFKNTGIANHCVHRPLNQYVFQVSSMIYPDFKNCRDVGWIACNSVLSGLYAKGIIECDSIMMNFVISILIADEKREKVIDDVVAGFKACAKKAKVEVTNSPLLTSSYMMIGGTATTICHIRDFATCDKAEAGDTIVLTKPLGVLVAVRAKDMDCFRHSTCLDNPNILSLIDEAFESAMLCMKRSNKTASILMKKYKAHAAIDLNGQNLLQTAHELAKIQKKLVEFRIDVLPLIKHRKEIDEYVESGLIKGLSRELCGGLLICFSLESAKEFINEITTTEGPPCFYIGSVIGGYKIARMNPEPQILPVTIQPKFDE